MQVKASEQVVSYFECGVCLQQFNESDKFPRILPCGHTFCERCIAQMIDKRVQFKCPYCNTVLGQLRLGLAYKNYNLVKLMTLNGVAANEKVSCIVEKPTYAEIVQEMERLPRSIDKLVIRRVRDDQQNPFDFDLIRSNRHSMRFFKLLVTFQQLTHLELWVKYSAHGFQECLAESLAEIKSLKYVRIVNAYDEYDRLREIVTLTANEKIAFEIEVKEW